MVTKLCQRISQSKCLPSASNARLRCAPIHTLGFLPIREIRNNRLTVSNYRWIPIFKRGIQVKNLKKCILNVDYNSKKNKKFIQPRSRSL